MSMLLMEENGGHLEFMDPRCKVAIVMGKTNLTHLDISNKVKF